MQCYKGSTAAGYIQKLQLFRLLERNFNFTHNYIIVHRGIVLAVVSIAKVTVHVASMVWFLELL